MKIKTEIKFSSILYIHIERSDTIFNSGNSDENESMRNWG